MAVKPGFWQMDGLQKTQYVDLDTLITLTKLYRLLIDVNNLSMVITKHCPSWELNQVR